MSTFHPAPSIRHIQSGFQALNSERLELIIQISSTSLAIAVFDEISATIPFLENYTLQAGYNGLKTHELVARILQSHSLTRLNYKKVRTIYVQPHYCLVPEPLFDSESASKLLELHCGKMKDSEVSFSKLQFAPILCVVASPNAWKKALLSIFPDAESKHYAELLAERVLSSKTSEESILHLHVHDFSLDIAYVSKDGLQYFNSFTYEHTDDFLYYVLLVCDRLSLDRSEVICEVSGEIDADSALLQSLNTYMNAVRFYTPLPMYSFALDSEGRTLPMHFFPQLTFFIHANYQR